MRFGHFRIEPQCFRNVRQRIINPARGEQRFAQIILRFRIPGAQPDRLLEVRQRVRATASTTQRCPQIIVRDVIPIGHSQRVGKKGHAVAPCRGLDERSPAHRTSPHGDRRSQPAMLFHQRRKPPRQSDREADERDICVTVGSRLQPDLHQSDHRNQRAQIPQPSHRDGRTAQRDDRDRDQNQHCRHPLPSRHRRRKRIEHSQFRRPEELRNVRHTRYSGILQAQSKRDLRTDCSASLLRHVRDHARDRGERK